MKLPPGRRVRARVVVGLGLGLRLVIAVRWWGAGERSGEGAQLIILIDSVPAAGSRTGIIYCREIAAGGLGLGL